MIKMQGFQRMVNQRIMASILAIGLTQLFLHIQTFFKNDTEVTGFYNNNTTALSKHRSHNTKGINIGVEFINEERFGFMSIEAGYIKSYWSTLGTDTYTPIGRNFGSFW
ncbi:MAG: hypothetical protein Q9M44_06065 [Ghiorsea sp.]|nr:hypothetical protein [Ghiorsea sp.]